MFLKLLSEYRWGCIKMTSEYAFDMVFYWNLICFIRFVDSFNWFKQNVEMGLSNRSNR